MSAPIEKMQMPMQPEFAGDEFDLHEAIDTLLQYGWLVGGVFAAVLAAGVGFAVIATPVYKADALIQVEEKKGSGLGGLKDIASALDVGQSPVQGEIEIIRSRDVLMKAIKATRADTEINVANRAPLLGDFFATRHERFSEELAEPKFGLDGYAWGGERLSLKRFELPQAWLAKPFEVRITGADSFELYDPEGDKLAAGKTGEEIAFKVGDKPGVIEIASLQGRPGVSFTLKQRSGVKAYDDVARDIKVAETARQSGVMRLSFEHEDSRHATAMVNEVARAYLQQNISRRSEEADQSLKFLERTLPEIKARLEESEQALNDFRTRTGTVNVEKQTESLLTRAVALEKDRVELQFKREQLSQRYKADYPEFKAINESLASNGRDQSRLTAEVNRLPESQKDLLRLARDTQVNTGLYTALLDNAQQLRVAKAGTTGNVRVIDYAVPGTDPVRPQRGLIVAVAAVLGLLLGVVAAFVARALRPTLRSSEELERATGLVTYATIPESVSQGKLMPAKAKHAVRMSGLQVLAAVDPQDPAVEALRSLRTGLAFALLGAANKTILITGPTQGLGKSFVTANLAAVLAQGGKRVLLIETDLRRPRLQTYFGIETSPGLSEVLAGSVDFKAALRRNLLDRLDVLPAGTLPPNPGELLLAPAMHALLEQAQADYDHILLDSAPVLPVGDTLALVPLAATTFIVARAEVSNAREVLEATKRITGAGGVMKGVIVNGLKQSRVGYGGYYRYAYAEK